MSRKILEQETKEYVKSARITTLRKILHMSYEQFGAKIGYSSHQIMRVESGAVTISTEMCEKITNVYNVRKEWLFGADGEPWDTGMTIMSIHNAGHRLKEVFEKSGLTQRQFCLSVGCTSATLHDLIEGKKEITLRFARRIEQEYNVGAEWLLYGDELSRDFPCGEKMIEFLKRHPEDRKYVWEKIQIENDGGLK